MYGSLVRRLRSARGMTQRELAEVSGLAQSNLSAIENDRRSPSAETLQRLVESCGFQLAAVAGNRVMVCPSLLEPASPRADDRGDGRSSDPMVTSDTPVADRVRVLTAVLDASEAIVRGRGWTSSS